jgi:asparagine synthase (glutamine-hydrolysing)
LLYDSCKLRLVSDVPLGTALSGGLDSSAVYSVVSAILKDANSARINRDSQRAFTAVLTGLPDDEEKYAERAARYVGTRIHRIADDHAGLGERIERDTRMSDFINNFPITSIASVYEGMRREGIVVSMDGHGVDEMMYGYRDMIYSLYNREMWQGSQIGAAGFAEILAGMQHPASQAATHNRFSDQLEAKKVRDKRVGARWKKLLRSDISRAEFQPVRLPRLGQPYDFSFQPLAKRMVYHEFFVHTLPTLLRNFDRAGMMNSVEIRMPFMDWRLVSYVFSLPAESKVGKGFTKLLLREAMRGKMDESIRTRTFKVGISSPVKYWFKEHLREWALDILKPGAVRDQLAHEYKIEQLDDATVRRAWISINLSLLN